jgi:hypothetical protein
VHQWRCISGLDSQHWEARALDDRTYAFINRRSNLCLDVINSATTDAAVVVQANCRYTNNQRWGLKRNTDGSMRVIAKHSGKCLDVAWADKANGGRLVQSRCWNGANQRWQITELA